MWSPYKQSRRGNIIVASASAVAMIGLSACSGASDSAPKPRVGHYEVDVTQALNTGDEVSGELEINGARGRIDYSESLGQYDTLTGTVSLTCQPDGRLTAAKKVTDTMTSTMTSDNAPDSVTVDTFSYTAPAPDSICLDGLVAQTPAVELSAAVLTLPYKKVS